MIKTHILRYFIPLQRLVLAGIVILASTSTVQAAFVNYTLENILTTGGSQLTGAFQWDYTEGDFENGTGTFSELFIPGHGSDIGALTITFDIGTSIEFSLTDNLHNEGVDVTLFLVNSLTPTSGSFIDLDRSKWAIGGGFNGSDTEGTYRSGSILPASVGAVPVPAAVWLFGSGIIALLSFSRSKRNI
ncbi:MAG: hypothetical protein GY779_04820 [Gammaproteobacteria bacterium]|nr:hypothetical protein [Gammaproteobacteria bacterium]